MGHLSTEKVVELARHWFYWGRIHRDINVYLRQKCQCVKQKKSDREKRASLVPIYSTHPFFEVRQNQRRLC